MAQELCGPTTQTEIREARQSVEAHLRALLDDISELQAHPEFLDQVETIQLKSQEVETWNTQREQLLAVEGCSASCSCDEGARLVVQEYNRLVARADRDLGLKSVGVGLGAAWLWVLAAVVAGGVVWMWWRRRQNAS